MATLYVVTRLMLASMTFVLLPYAFDLIVHSGAHGLWLLAKSLVPEPPRLMPDAIWVNIIHGVTKASVVVSYLAHEARHGCQLCREVYRDFKKVGRR